MKATLTLVTNNLTVPPRLCKDCIFYKAHTGPYIRIPQLDECAAVPSLVTGAPRWPCDLQRMSLGDCGPHGKLFQRKPERTIVQLWRYAAFFIIVAAIASALCAIGYALSWGTH